MKRPSQRLPHLMVIMMENKDAAEVVGQGSSQPYTNQLIDEYGLATNSYAYSHPSLPNYLMLVSGSSQGVTDDGPPSEHEFPGVATLATQLAAKHVSERAFAEDLPPDPSEDGGEYAVRHFPWVYFPGTPIAISDATSVFAYLDARRPPDFVWYTPNLIDDEHDGTVEDGDSFLSTFVPKVQRTPWYREGGIIVIEWDESDGDDSGIDGTAGGGRIPTIVVSAALRAHPLHDATPVTTAGILRSIEHLYGVGYLGAAADPASGNIDALLRPGRQRAAP